MKSPAELATRLVRQWQLPDVREKLLLGAAEWPIALPIGKPSATDLARRTSEVRIHLDQWRAVRVGDVEWEELRFRAGSEPVRVPVAWYLRDVQEWVRASGDRAVQREYEMLQAVLSEVEPLFHRRIVRQRSWLQEKTASEIVHAARVAMELSPSCAKGLPLRSLAVRGTDTKFFERHRSLMIELLDARYESRASTEGLEQFLGALDESDHWVLVAPLAPGLLPFEQQRVRVSELVSATIPGTRVVVVENESSLHQLPPLDDTVAILGAGLDLEWLAAPWLERKTLAYWGDIDTWGLMMLARARLHQPAVTPLLMSAGVFRSYAPHYAVVEPSPAGDVPPQRLTSEEQELYFMLRSSERGRLEQEFLPKPLVVEALRTWRHG